MSLYGRFIPKGPSGFGYSSTAEEVSAGLDLRGKNYLITGSNSGIGRETARVLSVRGATVLMAARSQAKAVEAGRNFAQSVIPLECDLSQPGSVRQCVEQVKQTGRLLDGIIANAGIMALPRWEQRYGCELQFLTNHVGHFILITGLLEQLGDKGRVTLVSSRAHHRTYAEGIQFDNLSGEKGYSPWQAYGQSKLANLLMARSLAKRFANSGRLANAIHPGVIVTNLGRHLPGVGRQLLRWINPLFLKSIPAGAATQTWVTVHPDAAQHQGQYLADCNLGTTSAWGRDELLAERLWVESEKIVSALEQKADA
ncbi:SDR family NAD(P)-dependent oxidoreductase [bacterium]|nr:SDR family NAD(P)-dependent oxidoreductase [bacterium]